MANHICKICNKKLTKYGFLMCHGCYNKHYVPCKDNFCLISKREAVAIIVAQLKKNHHDFWDEILNGEINIEGEKV